MRRTSRPSRSTSSALVVLLLAGAAGAQEIAAPDPATGAPQVELGIGLRGVTSANGYRTYAMPATLANPTATAASYTGILDFSDTYFYVRPRLSLYHPRLRVGSMIAFTFPDAYFEPGTILAAEANVFLEHQYFFVLAGRTRVRSSLVPFPTLRDDDLIRYTDAQNPFSDGRSTADHQFGNTVLVTGWFRPRWYVDAHAENMPNFILQPSTLASFELNSFGFDIGYQQIASLVRTTVVRSAGVGVNLYHVDDTGKTLAVEALGGVWLNLIVDPIHNLDWRAQVVYNDGVPRPVLATLNDTFRARQVSAVASLSYAYRRKLLPTFRTAVIGAYKRYVDPGVDQYSIIANAFYALGVGVEVGVQYQFRSRADAVPEAFGDNFEHALLGALVGRFDVVFNRQFSERDSILNTYSGYLP